MEQLDIFNDRLGINGAGWVLMSSEERTEVLDALSNEGEDGAKGAA